MNHKPQIGQLPERLQPYRQKLLELCLSDHGFHDLWDDYCELTGSLRAAEEMQRLRDALESEILEVLHKGTSGDDLD